MMPCFCNMLLLGSLGMYDCTSTIGFECDSMLDPGDVLRLSSMYGFATRLHEHPFLVTIMIKFVFSKVSFCQDFLFPKEHRSKFFSGKLKQSSREWVQRRSG